MTLVHVIHDLCGQGSGGFGPKTRAGDGEWSPVSFASSGGGAAQGSVEAFQAEGEEEAEGKGGGQRGRGRTQLLELRLSLLGIQNPTARGRPT